MPITTQSLLTDVNNRIISQYYNPTTDAYEAATGTGGSVNVTGPDLQGFWDLMKQFIQGHPARTLQYARTATDQMRVNVDSGTINTLSALQLWNAGGYVNWWSTTGAPNSMDLREQQRELSIQGFQQVRSGRWVIT